MKVRPDTANQWGRRVFYEDREFDDIMDELRARAGSSVFAPGDGVDVYAVLEFGFGVAPDFVDLPTGVLGRTRFTLDGRFEVEVSRVLAEEAEHDRVARRRLRSTLAHECGHGALHSHLYVRDDQTLSLFPVDTARSAPPVLCRQGVVGTRYAGEWWEFQANRGMTSLLLPRRLFAQHVEDICGKRKHSTVEAAVRDGDGEYLHRALADIFDVNGQMILYRFMDLEYLPADVDQGRLVFSE